MELHRYFTTRRENGVERLTGEVYFNIINYTYSSATSPNWVHQFEVSPTTGWGDARYASITASASQSGDCAPDGAGTSFEGGPIQLGEWYRGGWI